MKSGKYFGLRELKLHGKLENYSAKGFIICVFNLLMLGKFHQEGGYSRADSKHGEIPAG